MAWSQTGEGIATPIPVASGGTGATTAADARTNLGLDGLASTGCIGMAYAMFISSTQGWTAVGLGTVSTVGTASQVFADGRRWAKYTSAATTAGTRVGINGVSSANTMLDTGMDWTLYLPFRTDAALTNIRAILGATAGQNATGSDTPNQTGFVARFTEGTDTRLQAYARNAASGATSPVAFGPVLATNTSYILRIRFDSTTQTAYFGCLAGTDLYGDYGTEVAITTNIPATGTNLGYENGAHVNAAGTGVSWLVWQPLIVPTCVPA